MRYLTVEEILYIHYQSIERFGGLHGVRDVAGLESATLRPQTTIFGSDAYPTLLDKAAALLHSLVMNHPFHDGNKRTAFASTGLFLRLNGMGFAGDHRDLEDFIVNIAEERLDVPSIVRWLIDHTTSLPRF